MKMPAIRRLVVTFRGLLLLLPLAVYADQPPERGVRSVVPGKRWEDAFVTGNGRLGALLFGSPAHGKR